MVTDRPVTADEALRRATTRLRAAGIAQPRREATWLAEGSWGLEPGQVPSRPGRPVTPEESAALDRAVDRRVAGEPVAYVSGLAGFRHLTLRADRRALIPRPETEGLVELVLKRMRVGVAADVCTGSGCIALALAAEGDYTRVLGTDISREALDLARHNGARTGLAVEWREGHLLEPLAPGEVDVLVANPPYLTSVEYDELESGVRDHEPRLALESATDGLAATAELLREGPSVVRPGGWIALEVDCHRAAIVARLAAGHGWIEPAVHPDLFGRARYVVARRSELS